MAKSKTNNPGDPIVIKKYANRRLYNTQTSSYITLDFLADMTRKAAASRCCRSSSSAS